MRSRTLQRLCVLIFIARIALPTPVAADKLPVGPPQAVGGPYEGAPIETRFEGNDAEVRFLVGKYGMDVERAIDIANWLGDAAPLLTALPGQVDTYADARLVYGGSDQGRDLAVGELRIEIKAKHVADVRLEGLVEAIETLQVGDFRAEVAVDRVPMTLAELEALAEAERARQAPALVDIEFDFDRGELIVTPFSESSSRVDFASKCSNVSGGTLDGARRVLFVDPDQAGCHREGGDCTVAFPMRFSGYYGITTAGHCLYGVSAGQYPASGWGFVSSPANSDSDLYYVYTPQDMYVSGEAYWYRSGYLNNGLEDIGFIRRTSSTTGYPARIWKWDTQEWRHIVRYAAAPLLTGMMVCQHASDAAEFGAGTYCGEVLKPRTNYSGSASSGNYTQIDFTQNPYGSCCMHGGGGSSGSPMQYNGVVYGTFSAGGFIATYYRVDAIQASMAAVTSDVKFICYQAVFCNPS